MKGLPSIVLLSYGFLLPAPGGSSCHMLHPGLKLPGFFNSNLLLAHGKVALVEFGEIVVIRRLSLFKTLRITEQGNNVTN